MGFFTWLLPIQQATVTCEVPSEELLKRIRDVVSSNSLFTFNYWAHKGRFVGPVGDRRVVVRRFIRRFYVPLIIGTVCPHASGSTMRVTFVAVEPFFFWPVLAWAAFISFEQQGIGGLVFPALGFLSHLPGAWVMRDEIKRFMAVVRPKCP